jgi:hypothetical protein
MNNEQKKLLEAQDRIQKLTKRSEEETFKREVRAEKLAVSSMREINLPQEGYLNGLWN